MQYYKIGSNCTKIVVFIAIILLCYITMSHEFSTFLRINPCMNNNKSKIMTPIGAGWSFFLKKECICSTPLYTSQTMSGRISGNRWGSGTRIKDIQKYLTSMDQTLTSYPSIENGTLGGWIASGSHGSGGTLWNSNFGEATIYDQTMNKTFKINPKLIFNDDVNVEKTRRYIILDIEVNPSQDYWCKKYTFKMNNIDDAHHFLSVDTYLRMIQIGARGIMCLMWVPLSKTDMKTITHTDPHLFSQVGLWLQADVLSIFQNKTARYKEWFDFPVEKPERYTSKLKLSTANRFTIEPPLLLTPIGLMFINFEVFVFINVEENVLYSICNKFSDIFTTDIKGRCELRCGAAKMFLDFVVTIHSDISTIFRTLFNLLGPVKIRLHKGKAQVDTYPFVLNLETVS